MRANSPIRWGGLSALLSGVIGIAGEMAFFFIFDDRPYSVAALTSQWMVMLMFMMIATALGILGLTALYARQAHDAGRLGLVSFVTATIGTMMLFGHQWSAAFVLPVLARSTPDFLDRMVTDTTTGLASGVFLTFLLMAVGWVLFGVASLRAKVLPTRAAWLVILGGTLSLLFSLGGISLEGLVLYAGLAWMGAWLWRDREPTA